MPELVKTGRTSEDVITTFGGWPFPTNVPEAVAGVLVGQTTDAFSGAKIIQNLNRFKQTDQTINILETSEGLLL